MDVAGQEALRVPCYTRHPVLFVMGATGTGKSAVAIELCRRLSATAAAPAPATAHSSSPPSPPPPPPYSVHVVNCDVMQMYEGLPISTNKPTEAELAVAPHHLLGFLSPTRGFTVASFVQVATAKIAEICAADPLAAIVVVGGTHYYMQALMVANAIFESRDDGVEAAGASPGPSGASIPRVANVSAGDATLWQQLRAVDPASAATLHPNDTRRIARRLELAQQLAEAPSAAVAAKQGRESLRFGRRRTLLIEVRCDDRARHNAALDARVDTMVARGLVAEVTDFFRAQVRSGVCSGLAVGEKRSREREDGDSGRDEDSGGGGGGGGLLPQRGVCTAIGFKEFAPLFASCGEQGAAGGGGGAARALVGECVAAVKVDTRRYARQQEQWLRNRLLPCVRRALALRDGECGDAQDVSCPVWHFAVHSTAGEEASRTHAQLATAVLCALRSEAPDVEQAQHHSLTVCRLQPAASANTPASDASRASECGTADLAAAVSACEQHNALYHCELCEKVVCGAAQREAHNASRGHRSAVKRRALEAAMAAQGRTLPPRKQKNAAPRPTTKSGTR